MYQKQLWVPEHSYFSHALIITKPGGNDIVRNVLNADEPTQAIFLQNIVDGYYPISLTSPQALERIIKLSDKPETQQVARYLYEVEQGRHPSVGGTRNPHSEEFVDFVGSLLPGYDIKPRGGYEMLDRLDIPNGSLVQALATSYINEQFAPGYSKAWLDFRSQWAALKGLKSEQIKDWFVLEHRLTEGDEPGQHIGEIAKMLNPYGNATKTGEFKDFVREYSEILWDHLDKITKEIDRIANT